MGLMTTSQISIMLHISVQHNSFKCIFLFKDILKVSNSVCNSRGLSRKKIESVFRHFTKCNIRKTDSSQNATLEKRTLPKIQYEKNRLFTKFNNVHVMFFGGRRTYPPFFLEVKNVPCPFLEIKNKPFLFQK